MTREWAFWPDQSPSGPKPVHVCEVHNRAPLQGCEPDTRQGTILCRSSPRDPRTHQPPDDFVTAVPPRPGQAKAPCGDGRPRGTAVPASSARAPRGGGGPPGRGGGGFGGGGG